MQIKSNTALGGGIFAFVVVVIGAIAYGIVEDTLRRERAVQNCNNKEKVIRLIDGVLQCVDPKVEIKKDR